MANTLSSPHHSPARLYTGKKNSVIICVGRFTKGSPGLQPDGERSEICATKIPSPEHTRHTWPASCALFTAAIEGRGDLNQPRGGEQRSGRGIDAERVASVTSLNQFQNFNPNTRNHRRVLGILSRFGLSSAVRGWCFLQVTCSGFITWYVKLRAVAFKVARLTQHLVQFQLPITTPCFVQMVKKRPHFFAQVSRGNHDQNLLKLYTPYHQPVHSLHQNSSIYDAPGFRTPR